MKMESQKTKIGLIPNDWNIGKLGEITYINQESRDPSKHTPNDFFYYIDINSIEGGIGIIKDVKKIIGSEAPSRARRVIHENDIIMSTVRPYLMAFAIIPKKFNNQICSTGFAVLTSKKDIIPKFLLYSLFSPRTIDQCKRRMVGGLYPALNLSDVEKIIIPIPNLIEQKKIAEILSSVDEVIQKSEQIIRKTEKIKQGVMQRLLTNGIGHTEFKESVVEKIPKEWNVGKIKEIGEVITGTTPSTKVEDYWGDGVSFVTPGDINENVYVIFTEREVTEKGAKKGRIIPKDSVMVVCIGSTIGKVALSYQDCITNQQINSIICNKNIYPLYVYYYLIRRKNILRNMAGIAVAPIVKKSLFEKFKISIPSYNEQKEIADRIYSIDEKIKLERKRKRKFNRLKIGIMNDLLTGKKRVIGG